MSVTQLVASDDDGNAAKKRTEVMIKSPVKGSWLSRRYEGIG